MASICLRRRDSVTSDEAWIRLARDHLARLRQTVQPRSAGPTTPWSPSPETGPGDLDAAARAAVDSFTGVPRRHSYRACGRDGEPLAHLGTIEISVSPEDEGYTYLPARQLAMPLHGVLARDSEAARRWWPRILASVLRDASARRIDRLTVQVLTRDDAARSVWLSVGFEPDMTFALRDLDAQATQEETVRDSRSTDGVRPASRPDVPGLVLLLEEEIRYHAAHTGCGVSADQSPQTLAGVARGWTDPDLEADVDASAERGRAFVYERDGQIVGCLVVEVVTLPRDSVPTLFLPARYGYIALASTTASARRTGVGTALVRRAVTWLAGLDDPPEQIGCHYAPDNVAAAAFWLRCGYCPALETWRRRVAL